MVTRKKKVRAPLDGDRVVQAAFEVLEKDGLEGLTVRAIAQRLGVQNPALYWHVKNKAEIVDRMAARMLADVHAQVRVASGWQTYLTEAARAMRRVMLSHRDGAQVVASADLASAEASQHIDDALALLISEGFEERDALIGVIAVFDYTMGATYEQQADPVEDRGSVPKSAADGRVLSAVLKRVLAKGAFDGETVFEGGLRLVLDGLSAKRKPVTRTAPRRQARARAEVKRVHFAPDQRRRAR